jgi:CRISPR-associated endonuclease/helicase Cas3/CRISPR-associated protein Cas5t
MFAAAAGGWANVDPRLRFAMAFRARGSGTDLETYHPWEASGRIADSIPRARGFLADVTLTVWLLDDLDRWERFLRRPVFPVRLGRSQDLVGLRSCRVELYDRPGRQGAAVVPRHKAATGVILRLPSAVSLDRSRTRWDDYQYNAGHRASSCEYPARLSTDSGQAVALLPPTHPVHAGGAS